MRVLSKILSRIKLIPGASLLLLTGCAMGPDFKEPAAPTIDRYTAAPLTSTSNTPDVSAGERQQFVANMDIPGEWWKVYHSKPLDDLIDEALKSNPDIKAAEAALMVARENTLAQKGTFFPTVSGGVSASRQKTSSVISPATASGALYYNLYTPQVAVSFVPDVFGVNRRTIESLQAQQEQARYQLIAAHITLSANIVIAVIQEATLQAEIDCTRRLIGIDNNMLLVVRDQYAKGQASNSDVATQESQLAQISATIMPLLKQSAQQRDLIARLCGRFPSQNSHEEIQLSSLQLPQELPLTLPAHLVEQRPDIRQAEENLHAASAAIGIAVANRLPNFTLTSNIGSMALEAGQIFTPGVGFWTLAGGLTEPIFDAGTLLHKERAAREAYVEAAEQYRGTVLTAVQNVADTLTALEQDANALKSCANAEHATKVALELAQQQPEIGEANQLTFLLAQQAYQQAVLALVQAQANRYSDTAALFQALGGGWWNQPGLSNQ